MTIESSKLLGGVGAVLLLLGTLPVIGTSSFGVLGLVGVILIFIALNGFANHYQEKSIFTSALYGLVTLIVGGVAAVAAGLYLFFDTNIVTSFLQKLYPSWDGSWTSISSISGMQPDTSNIKPSDAIPVVGAIFAIIVIVWIVAIISAFFVRRSLNKVAAKSGTKTFSTAGLLLLIGAFLLIAFVIPGLVVIWIAAVVLAIAFFSMKTNPEQSTMAQTPPPPSTPTPV